MKDILVALPLVFLFFLLLFVPLAMLRSSLAQRVLRLVSDDAGTISSLTLLGGSVFAAPVGMLALSLPVLWLEEVAHRSSLANLVLHWASQPGSDQPGFHLLLMAILCCAIACATDMLIIRWWVQGGRCPDLDIAHPQGTVARIGQSSFSGTLIFCWVVLSNVLAWTAIVALAAPLVR